MDPCSTISRTLPPDAIRRQIRPGLSVDGRPERNRIDGATPGCPSRTTWQLEHLGKDKTGLAKADDVTILQAAGRLDSLVVHKGTVAAADVKN
jgi:hypothetical protein